MGNDKNHLYTQADLTKDRKITDKILTQQQFSRFTITTPEALNVSADTPPTQALQIQTKPHIGDPIDDTIGDVGFITQGIFLDIYGANYTTMSINGDVTFAFLKIPKGRHISFTIDFIVNTVTPPTVLFPQVINPPTLPTLTNGLRVILHFIGVIDDVGERYTYIGGTVDTGGGGGIAFPIDFLELDMGSPVVSTTINFADSTRHFRAIELSDDLIINLTNIPAAGALCTIYFTQDGTGNHLPTIPLLDNPDELANIGTTAGSTTVFTIQAAFGTVLGFTSGKAIFFGSSSADWATIPAVTDVDFNTFDGINIDRLLFDQAAGSSLSGSQTGITSNAASELLFNVPSGASHIFTVNDNTAPAALLISENSLIARTIAPATISDDLGLVAFPWNNVFATTGNFTGIDMNGATALIQGVKEIRFFDDDPNKNIQSAASELSYNTPTLEQHSFYAGGTEIARFVESGTGVYRLEMLDHSIRDAKDITFDNAGGVTSFAGTDPAIGYDSVTNRLIINLPDIGTLFITNNNFIVATQITNGSIVTDLLTANNNLLVGTGGITPVISGQFSNDGTDTFVFSGALVRNLSNIPNTPAATTELDNLTTTSINAALLPDAADTRDLGDAPLPWRILHIKDVEFDTDSATPTVLTATQIAKIASGALTFNLALAAQYEFYFQGVNKWNISATQLSGDNILLQASLVFNDSLANPIGDGEFRRNGNSMMVQSPEFVIRRTTGVSTEFVALNLVKVDASPGNDDNISKINFQVDDSGVITTYANINAKAREITDAGEIDLNVRADGNNEITGIRISGGLTSPNTFMTIFSRIDSDLVFGVETGSTNRLIHPSVNNLGFSVSTETLVVGGFGSMKMPVNPGNATNAAAADTDFGDVVGCEGLYLNSGGTPIKVLKIDDSPSTWATLLLVASGNITGGRLT